MKCGVCGEDDIQVRKCSYCGSEFCMEHRLPEVHDCPALAFESGNMFQDLDRQTLVGSEKEDNQSPTPPGVVDTGQDSHSDDEKQVDWGEVQENDSDIGTGHDSADGGTGTGQEDPPDPRAPTFEHSSPDVAPDGSIVGVDIDPEEHTDDSSSEQTFLTRRRVLAALGLAGAGGVAFGVGNGWFRDGLSVVPAIPSTSSTGSGAAAATETPTDSPTATPRPFDFRVSDNLLSALNQARDSNLAQSDDLMELASADAEQMSRSTALTPTGDEPTCQGAFQVLYQTWWSEEVSADGDTEYYTSAEELGRGVIDALQSNEEYDYSRVFSGFSRVGIGVERDEADRVWIAFWFC